MHYLQYDRDQLDLQYNTRARVPRFQDFFDRWSLQAEQYRRQHKIRNNLHYGAHRLQTLDYFPADDSDAPLLVFIHGGYWRSLDKESFSHVAAPFHDTGIGVVMFNYRLAPHIDMQAIVADVRSGFAWLHRQAAAFDFDADRIYLAGHSAGGHLAAMLAGTDWHTFNLPSDAVKGLCGVSGIYDLEPIRLCFLNEALRLDDMQVEQFSPLHHAPPSPVSAVLAVGSAETKEFHRQLAIYAHCLAANNCTVQVIELPGCNHFDMVDKLGDKNGELARTLITMILS